MNSKRSDKFLHTAFFIPDFRFSDEHRGEFKRRGLADSVVAALEDNVSELMGHYDTDPPNAREQKKRLQAAHQALTDCSTTLAKIDDLTAIALGSRARELQADLSFWDLCKQIDVYCDAARKAVDGMNIPKTGPEATKDTHIVIVIGRTLREFEIQLDDAAKGPFVTAARIVFEALGIAKAEPRNDVIRALQAIDNSTR